MKKTIAFLFYLCLFTFVGAQEKPAYLNSCLSSEQRAEDLISRMTLDEKVSQMVNAAAAIEHLNIPKYDWWNECLHGVARAGYATVFPQSISVAASFDTDLMYRIGDAISDEARAKYNDYNRKGEPGIYHGLTYWSPNINIFRDPRWGRGHETYGEDPYLTGQMATQFIIGLQGDNPDYLKLVATAKHYAVHSGPEPLRHIFDANCSDIDLFETYLPAFRTTVEEGKVYSIMGAYNRFRGQSCSAHSYLLGDILRNEWGFRGYVVSDCGAIRDIFSGHKIVSSSAEAAAYGIKYGCDLECGSEYKKLPEAIKKGFITEKEIDLSLKRLLVARIKLGMFDFDKEVPFNSIPMSVVCSGEHRMLSREAAQKSIVLLKNQANILPLKNDQYKKIAVIGPNADNFEALIGNYTGIPMNPVTVFQGIKNKVSPLVKVEYEPGCNLAEGMMNLSPIPSSCLQTEDGLSGVKGEYFDNLEWKGAPVMVKRDDQINFYWEGKTPSPKLTDDNFSIRWSGYIVPPVSGEYRLGTWAMPYIQVFLDGESVIKFNTVHHSLHIQSSPLQLVAGKKYKVEVMYKNYYGDAEAKLLWNMPDPDIQKRAIDLAKSSDLVVMALGLSQRLEGEEMKVLTDGFKGGDRVTINLPKQQEELFKAVVETGKPVVIVMLNGSAIAINYEAENANAILMAGYPGEEGGNAVADVLFGDYNPAGRLPVTWYKSIDDLPPFEDYSMTGRTYRYFKNEPLYPFGFGLSYTNFTYSNVQIPNKATIGDSVLVTVDITNSGSRSGDEVVQLYITDEKASTPRPTRSLEAFQRVSLNKGETKTVCFKLDARKFSMINAKSQRVIEPGYFTISVGGKQPGFTGNADSPTTQVLTNRINLTGKQIILKEK